MIRIGIYGYGNLGRGVEEAAARSGDIQTAAIFTRRDPAGLSSPFGSIILPAEQSVELAERIDVMIVCTGSAQDTPIVSPMLARKHSIVDSYDCHGRISRHIAAADAAAKAGGTLALVAAGWDPGIFSVMRAFGEAFIPHGKGFTFWGRGVSAGHSEAARHVEGVIDAREYTVPLPFAIDRARSGDGGLSEREMHRRECYVVAEPNADRERISAEIRAIPDYYEPYDTEVIFITAEQMDRAHSTMPHGGRVIRHGDGSTAEYSLRLDSNPHFTATVLLCYARAVARLHELGECGCRTVLDIPPAFLLPQDKGRISDLL